LLIVGLVPHHAVDLAIKLGGVFVQDALFFVDLGGHAVNEILGTRFDGEFVRVGRLLTLGELANLAADIPPGIFQLVIEEPILGDWFYTKDGKTRVGPLTDAQLAEHARSGQLKPADMVKGGTSPQWQPASAISGLFPPVAEFAPPAPSPPAPTSQPASKQEIL